MGRAPRQVGEGGTYHLMSRGTGKRSVFIDKADYEEFAARVAGIVERYEWKAHAYCLMPNHIHLAVTTPGPTVSAGMRDLLGGYARWFNRTRGTTGHVFSAHYRDVVIESDRQLVAVARYICRNPVRAGLVASPADWPWSSYAEITGSRTDDVTISDPSSVLGLLAEELQEARAAFRRLVDEETPSPEVHPELLDPSGEVGPALGIREVVDRLGESEGAWVCRRLGFRQTDIADVLGISRSGLAHRLSKRSAA